MKQIKRTCRICKITQPINEFRSNKTSRLICKKCRNKKELDRYYGLSEDQILKLREKAYYHKWKAVGIKLTRPEVYAKIEAQNFACAICYDEISIESYAMDHCHSTNKLREVLCKQCNKGLGMFDDDPHLLKLAAKYVEKHMKEHRNEPVREMD